jgi:hypothetical protein
MEIVPVVILYILLSFAVIFGVMYIIRRYRDKRSGRKPSKHVSDIKAEESEDKASR